ncbi:citrate synthase/methylcitrate synthase [Paenibacillus sp. MMS18-CY102]|uniref:citrate synthase/methylcitrate synthase n=1 Tax=Paenibacillus sp. MMS18-CY102 TaxID=2682849 RepID=UPI0013659B83|nr:citrate synthase/methylcitrate synthase [Paenibacillus sp. MMS18-CY102]MWC27020.1 citrate synthase [Paenibacillus sp. MMS18-CY102]
MVQFPGLEGVVAAETAISLVDGQQGMLIYRGHWAKDLAVNNSFEEVAYLLWYGRFPSANEYEAFITKFKKYRVLGADEKKVLESLPLQLDVMSALRTVISSMSHTFTAWPPTVDDAIRITAIAPTLIANLNRRNRGVEFIEPHPDLNHVANYLYMLKGEIPQEAHVAAMNAYAILTMEHGMNASTFSSRVVVSTQSDIVSAICAAIGAMKGPLHGGAPSEVMAMLDGIGSKENAEQWMREHLGKGNRLMGFGHRIYKTRDPRAEALKTVTSRLASEDPWLDLAVYVEELAIKILDEYKPGRRLYTNVEFFAAAVLRSVEMPSTLFTPTFTSSRLVGWTAHILEQSQNNRIYRPQSEYVGEMPI